MRNFDKIVILTEEATNMKFEVPLGRNRNSYIFTSNRFISKFEIEIGCGEVYINDVKVKDISSKETGVLMDRCELKMHYLDTEKDKRENRSVEIFLESIK